MRWISFWCLAAFASTFLLETGIAQAGTGFYASPKVMVGSIKAHLPAPSAVIFDSPSLTIHPITTGTFKGETLDGRKTAVLGALAFGYDFFERFSLPLRIEIELSTRTDGNIVPSRYLGYSPDDPNTIIPSRTYSIVGANNIQLTYRLHTVFANIFIDWHNESRFTPYAGGGIGLAFIDAIAEFRIGGSNIPCDPCSGPLYTGSQGGPGQVVFNEKRRQLAWHVELGVAYEWTEDFSFIGSFRYLDLGKDLSLPPSPQKAYILQGYYGQDFFVSNGPDKIIFDGVHQIALGFRYKF